MRIGITGHQNLNIVVIDWLKHELFIEIKQLNVNEAFSCLAIGADQIFAEIVLANEIPLTAVVPCLNYETTFDSNGLALYKNLLSRSKNTIKLNFEKPTENAFFEAGKTVVSNSDILFAIWDNLPAKGLGGTADIVSFASSLNKKIIHLNPITKTKTFINYG